MSTRYKFIDKEAIYFTTSTVVGCCDVMIAGEKIFQFGGGHRVTP